MPPAVQMNRVDVQIEVEAMVGEDAAEIGTQRVLVGGERFVEQVAPLRGGILIRTESTAVDRDDVRARTVLGRGGAPNRGPYGSGAPMVACSFDRLAQPNSCGFSFIDIAPESYRGAAGGQTTPTA